MLYVHSAQIILELIYYYSNQWRPFHCWGWCLIKSYLNITEGLISVHQASASCEIYVVKLLVTHGKLSRWSIYSTQKINIHTETHTHTRSSIGSGRRGPHLYPPFSHLLLWIPPPSPDAVICIIFMPAHLWTRTTLVSPF